MGTTYKFLYDQARLQLPPDVFQPYEGAKVIWSPNLMAYANEHLPEYDNLTGIRPIFDHTWWEFYATPEEPKGLRFAINSVFFSRDNGQQTIQLLLDQGFNRPPAGWAYAYYMHSILGDGTGGALAPGAQTIAYLGDNFQPVPRLAGENHIESALGSHWRLSPLWDMREELIEELTVAALATLFGMMIFHCKNVEPIPQEQHSKKRRQAFRKASGGAVPTGYYIIRVTGNSQLAGTDPLQSQLGGSSRAAHMVRGHIKNRKSGAFWWSPHVRGRAEKPARIDSRYKIRGRP